MAVLRDDPYSSLNFLVSHPGTSSTTAGASAPRLQRSPGSMWRSRRLSTAMEPKTTPSERFPVLKKFSNIVLKRGIIGDLTLWHWMKTVLDGQVQRTDGTIMLLDDSRQDSDGVELPSWLAVQVHRPGAEGEGQRDRDRDPRDLS